MKMGLSNLVLSELCECRTILRRWSVLNASPEAQLFRRGMKDCMNVYKTSFNIISEEIWLAVKSKLPWLYEHSSHVLRKEVMASASAAYLGLILYRCLLEKKRKDNDKEIDINIVLLYLGSDFLLDDMEVPNHVKKELKTCIDERVWTAEDTRVQNILDILKETLELEPQGEEGIYDAWNSEKKSLKQKDETDFETLWNISSDKGYKTIQMADKLINKGVELPYAFSLGSVTQHIDDLMDHATDIKSGIHTPATVCMKDGECLDYYLYRTLKDINDMSNDLYPMKIFFIQVVCSCGYHNKYTSSEMKSLLGHFVLTKAVYDLEGFVQSLIIAP